MNYVSGSTPAPVVIDDTEIQDSNLPEGMGYVSDDYVSPDAARRAEPEYVSTEERLQSQTQQAIPTASATTEEPVERTVTSIKDMEQDDELIADILQYREDRFGTAKDAKAANLLFGRMFGGQELTNENIVDDFMDNHRFITGNSMDAAGEFAWLNSLKDKEAEAAALGTPEGIKQANIYAQQRERALRLYQTADSVANLTDSRRYEQMSGMEIVGDVLDAVGGNVMAGLSDPMTVLTAGIGRIAGGVLSSAGAKPITKALISAATAAPIEAGGAVVTDIMVQNAEMEMGARTEIDYGRVATVAGVAALTSGTLSGIGKYNTSKRVSVATRGELDDALQTMRATQTDAAKTANNKNPVIAKSIRENLAKGISDIYGDKVFKRNKAGDITGLDSKVIKDSDYAKGFFKNTDIDEDIIEPTISFDIFERTTAALGDIMDGLNTGSVKLVDVPSDGVTLKSLTGALQKGERVSERMLNIVSNVSEDSMDTVISSMGKYGVTRREIGAALFVDASMSGRVLGNLSKLQSKFTAAGRRKTVGEVAEEMDSDAATQVGSLFRRLEDIRRLTLVSGVATAARNTMGQTLRSGVDTLVYGFESGLHTLAGTGRKKFGLQNTLSQLKHTYYDPGDAGVTAKFMLDQFPDQKMRFYNQYSEVNNKLAKKNKGQTALASQSNGLTKTNKVLDTWENGIHVLNGFNRFQEAVYRNGAFTSSIQRQLFDKGIDMVDVLKKGSLLENVPEDMMAKAVDDALEFTYAAQPKTALFRMANNFIVKSGLTTIIPFPRFMFKAMENTYNYNITGAATAIMRMGLRKAQGGQITDGMYRQLAEGIAGGMPLIALGYMLRDRDSGMPGTEWYMLEDGKGSQFDARPFFPLTPYLLIGEMLHRGFNPDIIKDTFDKKEMLEGFTGTNFRGTGPISLITEDLLNTSTDPLEMQDTYSNLGKYLGEMVSGYGQPIYQVADAASLFTDMNQRQKDYKEDPKYRDGVESFFNGFMQPINVRFGKIEQEVGEAFGFEPANIPDKEDPRFEVAPERVMPFMKLFFGATLERTPPKYVMNLYDLGFDYRTFMTRSSSPKMDRFVNRQMGEAMNREIPELLATAKEEGISAKQTGARVQKWITEAKDQITAEIKNQDDDTALAGAISRFRGQTQSSKKAALEAFEVDEGREPDMFDASDVDLLLRYTTTHAVYSKQR